MKKFIFFLIISATSFLYASSIYVLGSSNHQIQKNIDIKNNIVWTHDGNTWLAAKPSNSLKYPKDKVSYILLNNNNLDYSTKIFKKDSYNLKNTWNEVQSPKNGIDVIKSFSNKEDIVFVYVYDSVSKAWAGYSPNKSIMEQILNNRILALKYIEPGRTFFIYSKKSMSVNIYSKTPNNICKKLINSNNYNTITDSGTNILSKYSRNKDISIKSRYLSHFKRGYYTDSRVTLIYENIKTTNKNKNTKHLKYGAATPKISTTYSQIYSGKVFYIYDYFQDACYKGIFPSKEVPPFSSLLKLKEE